MASFWRTRNGWWHLRLGWRHFRRRVAEENFRENLIAAGRALGRRLGVFEHLKRFGQRAGVVAPKDWDGSPHQGSAERRAETLRYLAPTASPGGPTGTEAPRPLIFASCCIDETPGSGGWKYSGGIKELNLLVRLLRRHGYEAWMVTSDGSHEPWLVEHEPHLSLEQYRARLASGQPVRCVSSYAIARAFIDPAPQLYFWDMELALTDNEQLPLLGRFYGSGKLCSTAAISRTIQAWHMARFGRKATVVPNLRDEALFRPAPESRQRGRVGYMNEGDHTEAYVAFLRDFCARSGCELTFARISGVESECVAGFQACDFFLSLNLGKDLLWGEGCPRTVIEAMSCGAVVLAFDVTGNREMIVDGYNAALLPLYRVDLMAETLARLARNADERERLRANALALAQSCHKLEDRWPAVREFLALS